MSNQSRVTQQIRDRIEPWSGFPNTHSKSPVALFRDSRYPREKKRWKKSKILSEVFCPVPNILFGHGCPPMVKFTITEPHWKRREVKVSSPFINGLSQGHPLLNWIFSLTSDWRRW